MSDFDEHRTRRFNKRLISITIGILLLTLLLIACLFEWTSRHRLNAAVQAWRAAGEPVEAGDFADRDTVPDNQNAAVFLRRAESHLNKTGDPLGSNDYDFDYSLPLPTTELRQVNDYLARNQLVLADLRAAAQLPRAQWKTPPLVWLDLQQVNLFSNERELIDVLGLQALVHLSAGDEAAAADDITDMLHIADHIGHIEPTLIDFLVATGCRALACDRCERWVTADVHAATRPASPAQRQMVIAQLLDTAAVRREWHDALIGERATELRFGRQFIFKSYFPPMERQRLVAFLKNTTQFADLDLTSNWPSVSAKAQQLMAPAPGMPSIISLMRETLQPSFGLAPKTAFQGFADRRLVAVGLAIRWYRIDHDGNLPPTLDALVPRYLSQIPDDPYAPTPQPFHYLPAATQPCIYSIGENGIDDGGSTKLLPHEHPATDFFRWQDEDAVLFLLHPPPQPPKPDDNTTPPNK